MNRRLFISTVAAGITAAMTQKNQMLYAAGKDETKIKAIAFDAFPIFDPRPVFSLTSSLFPDHGGELGKIWRMRQFEYTWLRVAGQHYRDFWQVTEDALIFAAESLKLKLTTKQRQQLMQAYLDIKAWPDVKPALEQLKNDAIKLAFLSNMTPAMLQAGINNSGLGGYFDFILSTDMVKTYKPDPQAYQLGPKAFNLKKEEIVFTAFAGWDAVGAKWFGYPTFWLNRLAFPAENLDMNADATGSKMEDLVRYVKVLNRS